MHPDLESYFNIAFVKRWCSQVCFCLTNPVTAVLGSLFPCLIGPPNEMCCAYSTFMTRQISKNVALTQKGITIKTTKAENKKYRRYRYQDAPTASLHSPKHGIHALDQFSLDREYEKTEDDAVYDTRRLYFDQIRSARVVPDGGYHVNCMCFCCCGFKHIDSNIKFVRIDIGRDNEHVDKEDLNNQNPLLVGLLDAERFCREVNKRARGGKRAQHGETKVVDAVLDIAPPAAPLMSRVVVPAVPLPEEVATKEATTDETELLLSTELSNLNDLFLSGALTGVEFQSSKDACIKRYS